MKLVLVSLIFSSTVLFGQKINLTKGSWSANLELNQRDKLPFKLIIEKKENKTIFSIQNGAEIIQLTNFRVHLDTVVLDFPSFNSSIHFRRVNNKKIVGYWQNYNKGANYKIPFSAKYGYKTRFENNSIEPIQNISGNWKVKFDYKSPDESLSLGVFKQTNTILTGTFLTETGDYRFLEGNVFGDSFHLSCFDGSHAFLFNAQIINDSLNGLFLSGKHSKEVWNGVKDESFKLPDPDSLTKLINPTTPFTFQLKDLEGNIFVFPTDRFKNKVVIIQIMGTWCPNCMDETRYYKKLYENYHDQGLEIISIGYEIGVGFEEFSKKIKLLQERLNLPFTFLVGGAAKKDLASKQFSMLNEVISFPTSIFIGKDGSVKRVHTGFNGPGTGSYYIEYEKQTNKLIEELLKM